MHGDIAGEEWTDEEFAHDLGFGIAVGVPLVYVLATLITWSGGFALGEAAAVALLPAFFLGPWAGGLIAMGRSSLAHEKHGEVVELERSRRVSPRRGSVRAA